MAFNLSVTAQELNSAVTKANAAAPQSTTYTKTETDTLLSGKVNAETGKGLSTNDFTTTEKNKLSGIEQGATKTVIDATLSGTSTNPVQNKVIQATVARLYEEKISHELPVVNGSIFEYADSLPAGFYHARQGYGTGSDKPVANEGYVYLIAVLSSATAQITAFTAVKEGAVAIPNIYTAAKLAGTWGAWYCFEGTSIT